MFMKISYTPGAYFSSEAPEFNKAIEGGGVGGTGAPGGKKGARIGVPDFSQNENLEGQQAMQFQGSHSIAIYSDLRRKIPWISSISSKSN